MRGGRTAYSEGKADPAVSVYLFKTSKRAARSLAQLERALDDCWGRHHVGDGYRVQYRSAAMPRLGAERFAFRKITTDPNTGRDWTADTWTRQGRFLVNVWAQKDRSAPSLEPVIGLARAAVRAAG